MIKFLRQLHRFWFIFLLVLFYVLCFPVYLLCSRNPKYYGVLNFFRKLNSYLACLPAAIFFKFSGEKLDPRQTYIYCSNHTSLIDILIFCILGRGRYHFMGKVELLNNPFFKLFFTTIDIPVNRESKISAFKAFKKAGENLRQGMSLIIFPEGKIDDAYPPKLHEFKNGPFRLAIEHNIPLVPVTIVNAWKIFFDDGIKYGSKPGICDIYIHKPISTAGLSVDDADVLKEKVFNLINSKLI